MSTHTLVKLVSLQIAKLDGSGGLYRCRKKNKCMPADADNLGVPDGPVIYFPTRSSETAGTIPWPRYQRPHFQNDMVPLND